MRNRCRCIWPGQVQGGYATWTVCKDRCDVYIHEIASQTTNVVANPGPKQQYLGGVTSSGLVYLARSGNACGASVRIVGVPYGSGSGDTIYALPDGRDLDFSIYVHEDEMGTGPEVYFSRFACTRNGQADIYVLADAFTPTHPASTERTHTRTPTESWRKLLPAPEAATPS